MIHDPRCERCYCHRDSLHDFLREKDQFLLGLFDLRHHGVHLRDPPCGAGDDIPIPEAPLWNARRIAPGPVELMAHPFADRLHQKAHRLARDGHMTFDAQDVLVARAEASSEAGLDRLMAQIDAQLAASGLERGEQAGH